MKRTLGGLLAVLLLGACSGTGSTTSATAPVTTLPISASPVGPTFSPTSPTPTPLSMPTSSGQGFCADRPVVARSVALVRRATEPYRQVVRFVRATQAIVQKDATSASSTLGAFKIRQLAIVIGTLAEAVKGAAENYPDDFAVREWRGNVPARVRIASKVNGCR